MNDYHRAPAVRYPTERPHTVAAVLVLVSVLSTLLGLWWWQQQGALAAQGAAIVCLWLLCSAAAWRAWRRLPLGELAWDGAQWTLAPRTSQQSHALNWPQIRWDGQFFLLLSTVEAVRGHHWLWLQRSSAPQLWSALRRALHARPGLAVSGASGAPT